MGDKGTGNKYTNIFSPWQDNYRAVIFWLVRKKMAGEGENAEAEKSPVTPSLHLHICPSFL